MPFNEGLPAGYVARSFRVTWTEDNTSDVYLEVILCRGVLTPKAHTGAWFMHQSNISEVGVQKLHRYYLTDHSFPCPIRTFLLVMMLTGSTSNCLEQNTDAPAGHTQNGRSWISHNSFKILT